MTRPDVAVIGGGLAGTAAALTAAEAGARVTLVEQRPHLGGAASSFHRNGMHLDYGQHVFLRCCSAYRSLIRRIGGEERLFMQDRLEVPVFDHDPKPAWIRRGSLPPPLHLTPTLARYGHLSRLERLNLARAARALRRLDSEDVSLDDVSFGPWLQQKGQSERAIEAFWDLIARPTLNLPAGEASLLAAARTFQIGILTDAHAADIGWANVPLSYLHDDLAGKALVSSGVEIRLRTTVREIDLGVSGRPRLVLVDGSAIEPGAVISAVPPRAIPALLPSTRPSLAQLMAGVENSPIVNVHLRFDEPVMPYPIAACLDSAAQWIFDRTASAGVASGQYLVVSISAADRYLSQGDGSITAEVLEAMRRVFPRVARATLHSSQVIKDAAATIRLAPGSARLRAAANGSLPGLLFAGAWTDTGWPPTMEGAVRSGITAAETIVGPTSRRVEA